MVEMLEKQGEDVHLLAPEDQLLVPRLLFPRHTTDDLVAIRRNIPQWSRVKACGEDGWQSASGSLLDCSMVKKGHGNGQCGGILEVFDLYNLRSKYSHTSRRPLILSRRLAFNGGDYRFHLKYPAFQNSVSVHHSDSNGTTFENRNDSCICGASGLCLGETR